MHIARQVLRRLRTELPRRITLNGHTITLPRGHRLDWHRTRHSRYDEPVADLAKLLVQKFSQATVIDVGANVGDTAALMARPNLDVLCVEGNPAFLPLLRRNLGAISPTSEIAPYFVSHDDTQRVASVRTRHGTAALSSAADATHAVEMLSLTEILERHPKFKASALLKIDTDGWDAKIVMAAIDLIGDMRPIVHVEYTPVGDGASDEYMRMLLSLSSVGYDRFHVFDNYGNHMLKLGVGDLHHMRSLSSYVQWTRGDLRPALFYYDICAMTSDHSDISLALWEHYVERKPLKL